MAGFFCVCRGRSIPFGGAFGQPRKKRRWARTPDGTHAPVWREPAKQGGGFSRKGTETTLGPRLPILTHTNQTRGVVQTGPWNPLVEDSQVTDRSLRLPQPRGLHPRIPPLSLLVFQQRLAEREARPDMSGETGRRISDFGSGGMGFGYTTNCP